MRLSIEIETREDRLAFDLFDATTLAVGISSTIPGKAILTFRGLARRNRPDDPVTVRLEVGLEDSASATEVAAWLCQRIGGRATALRVGGATVELDPEKVAKALVP